MSAKIPNKQSMRITYKDGTQTEVCCGPMALSLGSNIWGYERIPEKIQCQNRGDIERCPVRVQRAEARKKVEKRIAELRAKAAILRDTADGSREEN